MRLNDIERKVLTIIRNTYMIRSQFPAAKDLAVRTGRSEAEVKKILNSLAEQKYISWDGKKKKVILSQKWERKREKVDISFLG